MKFFIVFTNMHFYFKTPVQMASPGGKELESLRISNAGPLVDGAGKIMLFTAQHTVELV